MKTQSLVVFFLLVLLSALQIHAMGISVDAYFDPSHTNISEKVRYVVEINNASPSAFRLPAVNGLRKISEQSYQSASSINGKISSKTSFIFTFIPERDGKIEMPEYTIDVDEEKCTIPVSVLTVENNPNKAKSQAAHRQPQGISAVLEVPEAKGYVGQKIPIKISLILNGNIQLLNNIKAEILGNDFLVYPLSQQPQSRSDEKQEIYTWNTCITPIKSGKAQVSFEVSCLLQALSEMGFFSFAEQVQKTILTEPVTLEIKSLPTPPGTFTGGIGDFELKNLHLSSDRALIGEPITLSIDITGDGNFERLQAPAIVADEWRCFNPKMIFKNYDESGLSGTKTVEYVIIPQQTGELALPEIKLHYFSLKDNGFKEICIDTKSAKVLVSRSLESLENVNQENTEVRPSEELAPPISELYLLAQDTQHYTTLRPWVRNCYIWKIFGIGILGLAILFILLSPKSRQPVVSQKSGKYSAEKERQRLFKMIDHGDIIPCYKAARELLEQQQDTYGSFGNIVKIVTQKQSAKDAKWFENFVTELDDVIFGQKKILKLYARQQIEHLTEILQKLNRKK